MSGFEKCDFLHNSRDNYQSMIFGFWKAINNLNFRGDIISYTDTYMHEPVFFSPLVANCVLVPYGDGKG